LDIQLISNSCVKIILTKQEADSLDMDFNSFEKDSPETKTFLGYILNVMVDMGIIQSPYDKISVEIFEQTDGDMVIYISSYSHKAPRTYENNEFVLFFKRPEKLVDFLYNNRFKKIKSKLYLYNGSYALVLNCTKHEIPELKSDRILIAKIKEYGTIICNTPFETLI